MTTLQKRFVSLMLDGTIKPFVRNMSEDPEEYLRNLVRDPDGTAHFSDLNYADDKRSGWEPNFHMGRLYPFALYRARTESDKYDADILALIDYWLAHDYICPNWWYNQISLPSTILDLLLLLGDAVGKERKDALLLRAGRGTFDLSPELMTRWTGANLLWFAAETVRKGIIVDSPEILKLAVGRASEEIGFCDEGLQEDGSFYQHGHRLYSLGYGRPFFEKTVDLMLLLSGSEYQFSKEKMSLMMFHVLDGIRYMTHKGYADYAASGREYVRPGALRLESVKRALRKCLLIEEMPRKDEIVSFADAIEEHKICVSGLKYYPRSAFMLKHFGDVYISFKGTNETLFESEIINGEAVLGYNLSYGTHTTVMTDGDEYDSVAPLWDYTKIPGTTAPFETDEEIMARPDWSKRCLTGAFGGRTFDNENGIIYESTEHEGIHATVCAFFTKRGVVLLGTDLKDDACRPLTTTVEQCHLKGGFAFDGRFLTHGGAIYESLDDCVSLCPSIAHREGSFKRTAILTADRHIEGDILTVTLQKTKGHDSYAYRISPKEEKDASFTVLRNDATAQAIALPDGGIMAHFYKDGTVGNVKGKAGEDIFLPET